jgi:uncharacterized membrane protein
MEFNPPGPGTAMGIAAALAAVGAAYSYTDPTISKLLVILAGIFAVFTLIIERWSGPYHRTNNEIRMRELDLIEKLHEMLKKEVIKEEEFQKIKQKIFRKF